jgi:hypothetical protein
MKNPFTYRKRRRAEKARLIEDYIKRGRAVVAKKYRGLFYDADGKCFGAMTRKGEEYECYSSSGGTELGFQNGRGIIKDAIKKGYIPLDEGGCLVFGYVVKYHIRELK